ncbi:OLC1v1005624C1 [Oldenlandia corymbosa var. corymbosa]|uniref:OLC1v1005624C1 n=1 Tax=Oldenlandia corymbosa var. corymbosa TaxID=529605 RepID=A0AAV1DFJ2_OLDCO|nr:OLC1v1005624C1 [Oldenlandia corymbosa var. corymbosa]
MAYYAVGLPVLKVRKEVEISTSNVVLMLENGKFVESEKYNSSSSEKHQYVADGNEKNSEALGVSEHFKPMKILDGECIQPNPIQSKETLETKASREVVKVARRNTKSSLKIVDVKIVQSNASKIEGSGKEIHGASVLSHGGKASSEKGWKMKNSRNKKSLPKKKIKKNTMNAPSKKRSGTPSDSRKRRNTSIPKSNAKVFPVGFIRPRDDKEYREELISTVVRVWCPKDQRFYLGKVEAYDPTKQEHMVSYLDNDIEFLKLENELWLLHKARAEFLDLQEMWEKMLS